MPNDFDKQKNKDRFDNAQAAVEQGFEQGQEKLKKTAQQVEDELKYRKEQFSRFASSVDQRLHENPWPIVAGVGVGCLLMGIILGSRRNY